MKAYLQLLLPIFPLVVAGCSSTRQGAARVSYVEPAYPTGYTYSDTTYTDITPAHDRSQVTIETTYRDATAGTMPSDHVETRRVAMPSYGRYDITLDELGQHVRNDTAVIVDARESKHFRRGHVRGAMNIPVGDEQAHLAALQKAAEPHDLIIVYCGGPDCPAGDNVAAFLNSQGFTNVRVYKPGWQELSKTDLR